jgi:hypothetical protein
VLSKWRGLYFIDLLSNFVKIDIRVIGHIHSVTALLALTRYCFMYLMPRT